MLSKLLRKKIKLFSPGFHHRNLIRTVQPRPQIAVTEQVEPQHRRQIRQAPRPCGFQLEKLQEEHGNQRCPNLRLDRVLSGAHNRVRQRRMRGRFAQTKMNKFPHCRGQATVNLPQRVGRTHCPARPRQFSRRYSGGFAPKKRARILTKTAHISIIASAEA